MAIFVTISFPLLALCSQAYANEFNLKITGPKSYNDNIAIVGAGPSGIHMAYLLKLKGFKNIEILEKSSRIGGKSYTIYHRGSPQDMGTCYISPHYDSIISLIKKYTPNDLVHFPSTSIWLDEFKKPVTFGQYVALIAMGMYKTANITVLKQRVYDAIIVYVRLHQFIFGEYELEIMPKPNKEKLYLVRGTFWQFLIRNNLVMLTPLFEASTTLQGYGQLHEISALYGLMWNNPKVMEAYLARMKFGENADVGTYMLKEGFQNLWEVIAKKNNLNITYNTRITKIKRESAGEQQDVWISKTNEHGGGEHWQRYDFLIWSPEIGKSLSLFENKWGKEEELLSRATVTYFTTTLFNSQNQSRGLSPIDYWIRHVKSKGENTVWAQRDTYAIMHHHYGLLYKGNTYKTGDDTKRLMTSISYQMGAKELPVKKLNMRLKNHFRKIGAKNIDIERTITWRFFPRYSVKDMEEGILWKILKMQGKYSMWYIGSSVSFESVKSVVEYNKLLVKLMKVPKKFSKKVARKENKKLPV